MCNSNDAIASLTVIGQVSLRIGGDYMIYCWALYFRDKAMQRQKVRYSQEMYAWIMIA